MADPRRGGHPPARVRRRAGHPTKPQDTQWRDSMTAVELPDARARAVYVSGTAFDDRRVGAAAVYCSDGRFGDPMDEFLHAGLGLPRYDRVAVPGGAACLAGHLDAYHEGHALSRQ